VTRAQLDALCAAYVDAVRRTAEARVLYALAWGAVYRLDPNGCPLTALRVMERARLRSEDFDAQSAALYAAANAFDAACAAARGGP